MFYTYIYVKQQNDKKIQVDRDNKKPRNLKIS